MNSLLDCMYYISRFSPWTPQQITSGILPIDEMETWMAIIENRQDLIFFYAREDEMNG